MAWSLPRARKAVTPAGPDTDADDARSQHVSTLAAHGIPEPGSAMGSQPRPPTTEADLQALYGVAPSFADLLPWMEYLPGSKSMLLEDGQSVAGFFELAPVGTEGREMARCGRHAMHWRTRCRTRSTNSTRTRGSCSYARDESTRDTYLRGLADYVRPRARGSAFTDFYLRFFGHHLRAIAKPGGLFEDTTVTRLPWRGGSGACEWWSTGARTLRPHRGAASSPSRR